MTEEHEQYLKTVYPKMFAEAGWGPYCNDGWFDLINTLCRSIQAHCDWKPDCPQVTVAQVKEKFGTLRFYYDGGDEYVAGAVALAESLSGVICEDCGVSGTIDTGERWVKVLCEGCRTDRQEAKRERERERELVELNEKGKSKP
jgi:hypothetical protein